MGWVVGVTLLDKDFRLSRARPAYSMRLQSQRLQRRLLPIDPFHMTHPDRFLVDLARRLPTCKPGPQPTLAARRLEERRHPRLYHLRRAQASCRQIGQEVAHPPTLSR
jgi:hypothetical protein